jgi:bilin biosynthesis protein
MVLGILKKLFKGLTGLFWNDKPNINKMKNKKDIEGLIEALNYKDESIQLGAIKALGSANDPRAIDPLIKILRHYYFGNFATFALGKMGEPAIEPLINSLKDKNINVRMKSAYALGLIGTETAVKPLNQLLDDENDTVRMDAAAALGMIGSKKAVEPLIKSLKDKHWKVRENSACSLGLIGDKKAIEPLNQMINDENKDVVSEVNIALDKIKF